LNAAKLKQKAIWEQLQVVLDKHNELKAKREAMDKDWNDRIEDVKVEQKKVELLNENSAEIRKKLGLIVEKYYAEEDAFFDQQKLIKKIEWLTFEKERIVERERMRKEIEEEEKKRVPFHPYQEQLDICDQLVLFCKKYIPNTKEHEAVKAAAAQVELSEAFKNKFTKGEIKPVVDKKQKEMEGMLIIGANKKKSKNDKKSMKKSKKEAEGKLEVDFGTLQLFDKIQLAPPMYLKDVSACVEKINQRKKHYEVLPGEEAKKAPAVQPAQPAQPVQTAPIAQPVVEKKPEVVQPAPEVPKVEEQKKA
jgi:hypothetical protein